MSLVYLKYQKVFISQARDFVFFTVKR